MNSRQIKTEQQMLDFGAELARELFSTSTSEARTTSLTPKVHNLPSASGTRALPLVLELVGDVGTGKTTFTRGFAAALGVKEPLASPSFTISRTYALPANPAKPTKEVTDSAAPVKFTAPTTIVHYDFYRLEDPGLMIDDLTENLADKNTITIIEWAGTVQDFLPNDRLRLHFIYNADGTRTVTIDREEPVENSPGPVEEPVENSPSTPEEAAS